MNDSAQNVVRNPTNILNKAFLELGRQWLFVVTFFLIILNGLPWLAPVFMVQGMDRAGNIIYFVYSFLCHQMPQRSFFLFGNTPMISLETVQMFG